MIVIAGYLITDALDFLYLKAVSWLAGDSRLRQTSSPTTATTTKHNVPTGRRTIQET